MSWANPNYISSYLKEFTEYLEFNLTSSSTFVFNRGSIFHVGGQTIILGKKKYYNAASGFKKRLRSNQRKILPLPTYYYYILTSSTNAQKCKTNQFSISNLRNLRDHHQTISQCDKIINEVSKLVSTNLNRFLGQPDRVDPIFRLGRDLSDSKYMVSKVRTMYNGGEF